MNEIDMRAGELPPLPEPCQSVMPSGWIRYTADQMLDYARAALAHKAAPAPAADQDALDAKRYRYIRDTGTLESAVWVALEGYESVTDGGELDQAAYAAGMDRAIDRAIQAATPVTDQPKQENQHG